MVGWGSWQVRRQLSPLPRGVAFRPGWVVSPVSVVRRREGTSSRGTRNLLHRSWKVGKLESPETGGNVIPRNEGSLASELERRKDRMSTSPQVSPLIPHSSFIIPHSHLFLPTSPFCERKFFSKKIVHTFFVHRFVHVLFCCNFLYTTYFVGAFTTQQHPL